MRTRNVVKQTKAVLLLKWRQPAKSRASMRDLSKDCGLSMVEKHRHREFIGYQVYTTQRALARSLDATLASFGLTSGQWNALNQLDEHGSMTQKELADRLDKEPATITRRLDRMAKKGLIERSPDPRDRRANIISITPEAESLLSEVEPAVIARAEQISEGISDEDLHVFIDVLSKVKDNANRACPN